VHKFLLSHTMETSQSTRKGARINRTVRSKPQRDWDAFSPAIGIPVDVKGNILLPAKNTRAIHEKYVTEGFAQEGKTSRSPSPQQKMPRQRGRPIKNQDILEAQNSEELCIRLVAEERLRCVTRLEPTGGLSHEDRSRTRRANIMEENEQVPYHQLQQVKLAIAKIYQENMELRRQLVTKVVEASTMQGHKGNMAWLKRKLREAQDTIVQL
jgi:hypothetical protein